MVLEKPFTSMLPRILNLCFVVRCPPSQHATVYQLSCRLQLASSLDYISENKDVVLFLGFKWLALYFFKKRKLDSLEVFQGSIETE